MGKFTLLHTSDWHLGHKLYSRSREDEFKKFTDWLADLIRDRGVDAVIIAGDVFHTPQPDSAAQKLYYDFLLKAARAGARHIIITAGNHDSPAFLTAPKELLMRLNVLVAGAAGDPEEGELLLRDGSGALEAVVYAIPFLREKDIRAAMAGEDNRDKELAYKEAVARHYRRLADHARNKAYDAPVIVTGHLFAANSTVSRSVERLYAGGEGAVDAGIFEDVFDYAALGHIHRPMKVGGRDTRRYAGSPIPIHFDEAEYEKSVVLARFDGHKADIELCPVPLFQRLIALRGSRQSLLAQIRALLEASEGSGEGAWLELNHDGTDKFSGLSEEASALLKEPWAALHCNPAPFRGGLAARSLDHRLEDYKPEDIFALCLDQHGYAGEDRDRMIAVFQELMALHNEKQRGEGF